jgi:mRNA interferase MazF
MRRGDIFVVAQRGVYEGKPRPAVLVQANDFVEHHPSLLFCLISSELSDTSLFRVDVQPTSQNGLAETSQVMVDKVVTIKRENVKQAVGTLDEVTLGKVNLGLLVFMGLG